tara:strand:+ start:175 stop:474 length:300 start_codon:yes stop_codon:yes gene_type:complete
MSDKINVHKYAKECDELVSRVTRVAKNLTDRKDMDNMKFAVNRLGELGMRVNLIDDIPESMDFKRLLKYGYSHYVVSEGAIVHVGSVKTVYSFALSKHP